MCHCSVREREREFSSPQNKAVLCYERTVPFKMGWFLWQQMTLQVGRRIFTFIIIKVFANFHFSGIKDPIPALLDSRADGVNKPPLIHAANYSDLGAPVMEDPGGKGQAAGSHEDQLTMHVTAQAAPPTSRFGENAKGATV